MGLMDLFKRKSGRERKSYSLLFDVGYDGVPQSQVLRETLRNPIAVAGINKVALAVSNLTFYIGDSTGAEVEHPYQSFLRFAGPKLPFRMFVRQIVWKLYLHGNAFVQIIRVGKSIKQLNVLPSTAVTPIFKDGLVQGYQVSLADGGVAVLKTDEVIHLKINDVDETNGGLGVAPIWICAESVLANNRARMWNRSMLENGAKPSGALITEQTLTEEQFLRLKEELTTQYVSAKNIGRPLLLEGGLKWEQIGLSPIDMDFYNNTKVTNREIALALGVPPELVGDAENKTYSNYEEARRQFYMQTVIPLGQMIADQLSLSLFEGQNIQILVDVASVIGDAMEESERWNRLINAFDRGVLTVNEVRRELGFSELEGGNTVYITANKLPVGEVQSQYGEGTY